MDKISPTPYHVQGQIDKVTIANFQFGYLVYLIKLILLGLLLFSPVAVWLSNNIADIQTNAGKLRSDVHQLTDSVNALVKNQKSFFNRFKITAKVIDAMEASLDALVLDIPVQTALSTRIAVASEAQQQLLVEYLPTIAGFDPVLKAIQVAVEESSSVVTDIAADLSLIEASTASSAADLTALLAAFAEYATVMEPIVSVITGDLSAVVGDYFNPIFKLGGWHIRSIHSTVDVSIKGQPIGVTLSAPITIPPIQLPPINIPPGFTLPVTVTNPFTLPATVPVTVSNPFVLPPIQLPPITIPPGFTLPVVVTNPFALPDSVSVTVSNPFTLPTVVPVQVEQSSPFIISAQPGTSLNVTVFNPFVLPQPFPVLVTNVVDVAVTNQYVLPEEVQVVFDSAESIFRTEVVAPEIFSVAVMNFPELGSDGCPCPSQENPLQVQVQNYQDFIDIQTDAHINPFFVRPISIPYTQVVWFVAEFYNYYADYYDYRVKRYFIDFQDHIHKDMYLEFDISGLGGCPGSMQLYAKGDLKSIGITADIDLYRECTGDKIGYERLFRRNTHHNDQL